MKRLASCIERIRDWMADNHLKLNEEKTQIIWLGTRQQLNKLSAQALTIPNATVQFSTAVKDLDVVLDSQLTIANHVAAFSRSCFFYIRQLKSIKQSLTPEAMKTLVSSAVELTTVTVFSQALVVNCFRGCKPSMTLLHVSSLGPGDLNT